MLFSVGVGRSQVLPSTATAKDVVMIVAISPAEFVDGVEAQVEGTVAYELESKTIDQPGPVCRRAAG